MNFFLLFGLLLLPGLAGAQSEAPSDLKDAQTRLNDLEERLARIEVTPARVDRGAFNPSIGMAIDALLSDANDRASFDLRAAELNMEAPIDPFLKGWAVITASDGGVDLEEAAMETTRLPLSLQITGGRVFAPFGRLAQWHDHELPMAARPNSLNAYVGGEAQGDGLQMRFLAPTPFFLEAVAGAFNKLGADNNRADNAAARPFDEWTYLGRLHAYLELTDDAGMDLGTSLAWTPKAAVCAAGPTPYPACGRRGSWRALSGADITLRHQPASGGLYQGIIWGTELLENNEPGFDPFTAAPIGRTRSYAGYSHLEAKLGRQVRLGGLADITAIPSDSRYVSKSFAGTFTFEFSQFNRLRLQYGRTLNNFGGALSSLPGTRLGPSDLTALRPGHVILFQWTTALGYHAHGFRGRWGT